MGLIQLATDLIVAAIGAGLAASGVIAYDTFKQRSNPSKPISASVASGYYGAITIGGIGLGLGAYSLMHVFQQIPSFGIGFVQNLEANMNVAFIVMYMVAMAILAGISIYYIRRVVSRSPTEQGAAADSKRDAELSEIALFVQIGFAIGVMLGVGIDILVSILPGTIKRYLYQGLGIITGLMSVIAGCIGLFLYFKLHKSHTQLISSILYIVVGILLVIGLILLLVFTGE